ncbi:MAG: antirestriction protein ArdA [Pirellulales bacterium]|nr:antirestriction protein ArdA [Pirellulales bacterium]
MIYVACLAAYNAGTLHGQWIHAAQDADSLHKEVQELLKQSPESIAQEWAIHDYEGFGEIRIDEYEPLSEVSRLALLVDEYGEPFAAYAAHVGNDSATEESFLDAYRGRWDSELAYAQDLFDELHAHELPEHLRFYIDYEAFSRDIFLDGHSSVRSSDFGVYVFIDA